MQQITDNVIVFTIIAILTVVSLIVLFIYNQSKIFKQRQQLQQAQIIQQKELLQVVIESQEQERIRVGRDLHDDVGTAISSLKLMIEMYNPSQPDDEFHRFISASKNVVDKILTDIRQISHNLSPATLNYYGLGVAIEEQVSLINQTGKLAISLINHAEKELKQLPKSAATALYRVLEELLNNTMKHAKATRVTISFLMEQNVLIINYTDNGIGIDAGFFSKGMGMQNIESRLTVVNASYTIETAPARGFSIQIKYTMTDNAPDAC